MIDPADKQTQALPMDEQPTKKRRGRPATGKAMTPAEKQASYRAKIALKMISRSDAHVLASWGHFLKTRDDYQNAWGSYDEQLLARLQAVLGS